MYKHFVLMLNVQVWYHCLFSLVFQCRDVCILVMLISFSVQCNLLCLILFLCQNNLNLNLITFTLVFYHPKENYFGTSFEVQRKHGKHHLSEETWTSLKDFYIRLWICLSLNWFSLKCELVNAAVMQSQEEITVA